MKLRSLLLPILVLSVSCGASPRALVKKPTKAPAKKTPVVATASATKEIPTWQKWGKFTVGMLYYHEPEWDRWVADECNGYVWVAGNPGGVAETGNEWAHYGYIFAIRNETDEPQTAKGSLIYRCSVAGAVVSFAVHIGGYAEQGVALRVKSPLCDNGESGMVVFPPEGLDFDERVLPGNMVTVFAVPAAVVSAKCPGVPNAAVKLSNGCDESTCFSPRVRLPQDAKPGKATLQFGVRTSDGSKTVWLPLEFRIDIQPKP